MSTTTALLGRGIYTVAEASRLVGLQESRIRRWLRGYYYVVKGKRLWSAPLVGFTTSEPGRPESLSFADLIEVLYLEHFTEAGVPTRTLRRASEIARAQLGTPHPFGTHRFRTDGRWILEDLDQSKKGGKVCNLITAQLESRELVRRLLKGDLELDGHQLVERWWPLTRRRDVVVDPHRRFGAPISAASGIPTEVLYRSFRAERSYAKTASWYGVTRATVEDAVRFEKQLAA